MLRELEVSAFDRSDVTLGSNEITLSLPVSKTDCEAKGCKRTWICICDRKLPCPFHVLKAHCELLDRQGAPLTSPLFPDELGEYCAKQGVVDTIKEGARLTGMSIEDPTGNTRLSGHTFRITGARYLSAAGLDPIAIQLLGRWGSDAVLTYLAEAPLMSMGHRLKLLESERLSEVAKSSDHTFSDFDEKVKATETFEQHKDMAKQIEQLKLTLSQISRKLDHHAEQFDGLDVMLDNQQTLEVRKVINTRSNVEHSALISLQSSPHGWRTKCGWQFAGKSYAETFKHDAPLIHTYKFCPKCHSHPDHSDNTTTSTSSDD